MVAGATDAALERDVNDGRILRTHILRPTWHFVTPSDIRWLLALTAPHVRQRMATYLRNAELTPKICARGSRTFERSLANHGYLTRPELQQELARAGVVVKGIRLALLTMNAELDGVICSGPWRSKQLTYALLDERVPSKADRPRDESLADLAHRFLASHGPATVRDFVWWSGLKTADARRGFDMNRAESRVTGGLTYWSVGDTRPIPGRRPIVRMLPIYDEYRAAYRDRVAVPLPASTESVWRSGATLRTPLVIDGQIAGTWRTARAAAASWNRFGKSDFIVQVFPSRRLAGAERRALTSEASRYERFLGRSIAVDIQTQAVKSL